MLIQSRMVGSERHNTRTCTSSVPSGNRTKLNRTFRVIYKGIVIGDRRNPERGVVVKYQYNNVDVISETYEDIATAKSRGAMHSSRPPQEFCYAYVKFFLKQ